MFEDIGETVWLEQNEITFTWLLFLVFTLYSFLSFDDFLLLGSRSLCTEIPIHGQNINTNILWSANFLSFLFWVQKCLWYGGRTNLMFCVCIRKCCSLARVATKFSFIQKERWKSTGKTFRDYFSGSGGRLWKGKVLAPFSFMVFHGLLVTL